MVNNTQLTILVTSFYTQVDSEKKGDKEEGLSKWRFEKIN